MCEDDIIPYGPTGPNNQDEEIDYDYYFDFNDVDDTDEDFDLGYFDDRDDTDFADEDVVSPDFDDD